MARTIEQRIRQALQGRIEPTQELAGEWSSARKHAEELVILICSRLDALANLSATRKSQRERFKRFLVEYSGRARELELVALPNMYRYLAVQYYTLPATIQTPGRLYLHDPIDEPFLRFIIESQFPISEDGIGRFLEYLSRLVQRAYRTTAMQSRRKPTFEKLDRLHQYIITNAGQYKRGAYVSAAKALRRLLEEFTLASVLYREYRSGSIHEYGFSLDDRFFSERGIYLGTVEHIFDPTRYLDVRFSAQWLIRLHESAVANYQTRLLKTKKLPLSLFVYLCEIPRELQFLDDSSYEVGRELRPSVGR